MGGGSSEREISLLSGAAVAAALSEAGYDVSKVEVSRENKFTLPEGTEAAFIMLHGAYGEDGGVQRDLRELGIPYTGSGEESSRKSFDKILTREVFEKAGVPVAPGVVLHKGDDVSRSPMPLPVVVKAPRQGSSVGVTIVREESDWDKGVEEAFRWGDTALVEKFIPGREWTVPVIGDGKVLPIVEVRPKVKAGWYDWEAKYSDDADTDYVYPEDDPANAELAAKIRELAAKAFKALDARGMGRVDFRITPEGGIFALENNNVPGCTAHSILPKSAARAGIPFPELCERLVEGASLG